MCYTDVYSRLRVIMANKLNKIILFENLCKYILINIEWDKIDLNSFISLSQRSCTVFSAFLSFSVM